MSKLLLLLAVSQLLIASDRSAGKEEKRAAAEPPAPIPARMEPARSESPFRVAMDAIVGRRPEPDEALIQYQKITNPRQRITVLQTFLDTLIPEDLEEGEALLLGKIYGGLAPSDVARLEISSAWKMSLLQFTKRARQQAQPSAPASASASASAAQGGAGSAAHDVKMAAADAPASASASASASAAAGQPMEVSPDTIARFGKMFTDLGAAQDAGHRSKILTQILMEIPLALLDRAEQLYMRNQSIYAYTRLPQEERTALEKRLIEEGKKETLDYIHADMQKNWVTLTDPRKTKISWITRLAAEDPYASGKLAALVRGNHQDPFKSGLIVPVSAENLDEFIDIIRDLSGAIVRLEEHLTKFDQPDAKQYLKLIRERAPLSEVYLRKLLLGAVRIFRPTRAFGQILVASHPNNLEIPYMAWTLSRNFAKFLHQWHDQALPENIKKAILGLPEFARRSISIYYFYLFGTDIDRKLGVRSRIQPLEALVYGQIPRDLLKVFVKLTGETINDRLPVVGTPLEYAIAKKYPAVAIRALIKSGANVNSNKDGKTPLVVATLANNVDAVKELLSYGADVNLGNLRFVAQYPRVTNEIRELLQKAGLVLPPREAHGGGGGAAAAAAAAPAERGAKEDDGDVVMLPLEPEAPK